MSCLMVIAQPSLTSVLFVAVILYDHSFHTDIILGNHIKDSQISSGIFVLSNASISAATTDAWFPDFLSNPSVLGVGRPTNGTKSKVWFLTFEGQWYFAKSRQLKLSDQLNIFKIIDNKINHDDYPPPCRPCCTDDVPGGGMHIPV